MKKYIYFSIISVLIANGSFVYAEEDFTEFKTSPTSSIFTHGELELLQDLSNRFCLNTLLEASPLDGSTNEFIYNGERITTASGLAHAIGVVIAGDRVGYVPRTGAPIGWKDNIIVDGVNYGPTSYIEGQNIDPMLELNDDHISFVRLTELGDARGESEDAPHIMIRSVYFDENILDSIEEASTKRMNGDYVIYTKFTDGDSHVFVNGEDRGVGVDGDFDGETLAIQGSNGSLLVNGVQIDNLGSGGMLGGIKDGHLIYTRGNIGNEHVILDGEDLGPGYSPIIEGDHYAFARDNDLIYDGINYGEIAQGPEGLSFSLAGDHVAFMNVLDDGTVHFNFDGEDYPPPLDETSRVQITTKQDCQPVAEGAVFPDVNDSSIFKDGIAKLASENIVKGYPDNMFRPFNKINRAEFLKIVIEAFFETPSDDYAKQCFPDVDPSEWFARYVCFAKEQKIIAGYPDGYFRPANNINRAEAMKIVLETHFEEVSGSTSVSWYEKYFNFAEQNDLVSEALDGWTHNAGSLVMRGEMAYLIAKILYPESVSLVSPTIPEEEAVQEEGDCPEGMLYYRSETDYYEFCYDKDGSINIDEFGETVIKRNSDIADLGGNISKYTDFVSVEDYINQLDGEILNREDIKNANDLPVVTFDHAAGGGGGYTLVFSNLAGHIFSIIYPANEADAPDVHTFLNGIRDTLRILNLP